MDRFKCRICGSQEDYLTILETQTPLAADVTDSPSMDMKRFPLQVIRCNHCGHVQLKNTLNASFYGQYLYTPSYASGFVNYIDRFVKQLSNIVNKPERKVLEIGSSNGYLLGKLQENGWIIGGLSRPLS